LARARGQTVVPLPPERAMALWVDPDRWTTWVDGFGRIVDRPAGWPEPGAKLVWESRPRGRGRVTEKVVELDRAGRFAVDVYDKTLVGRQTVGFEPDGDGCAVTVELDYRLADARPLGWILDFFFIRPRLRESQRRLLRRFAIEAAEEAALPAP
jgi:hypothetical protein